MKEKIYTIPITDGFAQDSECPFCAIFRKVEGDAINFMLGPAYMDKDVRMSTNEAGFCPEHYRKLYDGQNRLGLALMLHTHLHSVNELIAQAAPPEKRGFFDRQPKNAERGLATCLQKICDSCYVCNRIRGVTEQYIDNFFYMWKQMPEFAETVRTSRGFCLKHFAALMESGERLLPAGDYRLFADAVLPVQRDALARLEGDIGRFIQKFDYRNTDMPWGGAKDAVLRALARVAAVDLNPDSGG